MTTKEVATGVVLATAAETRVEASVVEVVAMAGVAKAMGVAATVAASTVKEALSG